VDAKAQFRSIAEPWADNTTAHGRLMLTVLGGLAEFEREQIRIRTGEGRARAKVQGKHMDRPPSDTGPTKKRPSDGAAQGYTARIGAQLRRGCIYHPPRYESCT